MTKEAPIEFVQRKPDFINDSYQFMAEDSQVIELEMFRCLESGAYEKLESLEQKWEVYLLQIETYLEKEKKRHADEQRDRLCLYYAGYITALFRLGERFTRAQWEDQQIAHIRTVYFDRVMEILYLHKYLKHGQLAELLHVSPSQLHQIIADITECPLNMINKEKHSKYTIYSLTPRGKQYIRQKESKNSSAPSVEGSTNIFYSIAEKKLKTPFFPEQFLDNPPKPKTAPSYMGFLRRNTQKYKLSVQLPANQYQYF